MSDPLLHRYVQQHKPLFRTDPDEARASLSRFSDMYKQCDKWSAILLFAAIVSALVCISQLIGFEFSAEFYGQKISDLPERAFLSAAISGLLFLASMMFALSLLIYDAIIKWMCKELYGDCHDLVYRSWLSLQSFLELPKFIKAVTSKDGERFAVIGINVCWFLFILIAMAIFSIPIGSMVYFCIKIADAPGSLANFEWWFVSGFVAVDSFLFLIGIGSLATLTGED